MQGAIRIFNDVRAANPVTAGEGIYLIQVDNTIESISAANDAAKDKYFQKLWLYPGKAVVNGKLTANAQNIFLGKSGAAAATPYTPDQVAPTDLWIIYELPLGQKMALSQVIIQGKAGDGVFFSYT